jgi:hypothetical protein
LVEAELGFARLIPDATAIFVPVRIDDAADRNASDSRRAAQAECGGGALQARPGRKRVV